MPPAKQPGRQEHGLPPATKSSIPAVTAADMQVLTDTLATAKALLEQAVAEVQAQLRLNLGGCLATLNGCNDSIRKAMSDAVGQAYKNYSGAAQSVRDNLGYLMSAAQQYAGILGYPGVPADIPQGIPISQQTVDLINADNPYIFTRNLPLPGASGVVVPRDVGIDLRSLPAGVTAQYPGQTAVDGGGKVVPLPSPLSAGTAAPPATVPAGGGVTPIAPVATIPIQQPPIVPSGPSGVTLTPSALIPPVGPGSSVGMVPIPGQSTSQTGVTIPSSPVEEKRGFPASGFGGFVSGVPSAPTSTGCPTSPIGLPTADQLYGDPGTYELPLAADAIPARIGMYFTSGAPPDRVEISLLVPVIPGDPAPQVQGPDGSKQQGTGGLWTINGQKASGWCCNCPAPAQPPSGIIGPPIAVPPVDSCESLPTNQSNWTPWQLANCGVTTIAPQTTTTPTAQCVPCPPAVVNFDISALCNCISQAAQQPSTVPVDLDQLRAWLFSPDDLEWKKTALDWSGPWLQELNAFDSAEELNKSVLLRTPTPTRSDN